MLSAAGLSGPAKPKTLALAPPPAGAVKIRSPLPPPPNDPAASRMTSASHGNAPNVAQENSRRSSTDVLSDLSQLEVCITFSTCLRLAFISLLLS